MELWPLFFSSVLVGLSEFGDKTFIALMVLSASLRRPVPLWLGTMLGYLVLGTLAVTVGAGVVRFLPDRLPLIVAGLVFIGLGIWTWWGEEEKEGGKRFGGHPFWIGFFLVLTAEFADKSQIAMATLSARFSAYLPVLIGALIGVGVVDGLAIVAGARLSRWIPHHLVERITALLFMGMGVVALILALTAN